MDRFCICHRRLTPCWDLTTSLLDLLSAIISAGCDITVFKVTGA
jgi:hypothetical protein